ncbi:MAG TPA: DUF2285 domain-containing protein [Reyranella sp.]|nr:DUF2285 domain-containing protein [Reyranella sp.]
MILVPAPEGFGNAYRFESFADLGRLTECPCVVDDAGGPHYLWLQGVQPVAPMAALVPLDETVLLRLAGLLRFKRRLDRQPAGALPPAWRITARLRNRLLGMIRALDGHLAGASYREIALALYGTQAVARFPWKTSSIRGQTIRLVTDAVAMMNGGYRKLLRGGR